MLRVKREGVTVLRVVSSEVWTRVRMGGMGDAKRESRDDEGVKKADRINSTHMVQGEMHF